MHIFQFPLFASLMVLMTGICSELPGDCRTFRVGFYMELTYAYFVQYNMMYGAG